MASNQVLALTHSIPREILENILANLSFEEVSNVRRICGLFDKVCQSILNQGFNRVDKFHAQIQREVKTKLPRRESERRNHPLARHVDILAAIETRLSLLSMTYMKYIDSGVCSFIPGKVLDELYRVLWRIRTDSNPPRAHELLQELRDISSMAMEHFDEHIAPDLKNKMPPMQLSLNTSLPGSSGMVFNNVSPLSVSYTVQPHSTNRHLGIRQDMTQLKANLKVQSVATAGLKREINECKTKVQDQAKKILEQDKKIIDQNRMIAEQNRKIGESSNAISDLTSKLLAQEQKINELIACNCLKEDKSQASCDDALKKDETIEQDDILESGRAVGSRPSSGKIGKPSRKRKQTEVTENLSAQAEPTTKYPKRSTRSRK